MLFMRSTRPSDKGLAYFAGEQVFPRMEDGYTCIEVVTDAARDLLVRDGWWMQISPAMSESTTPEKTGLGVEQAGEVLCQPKTRKTQHARR